MTFTGTLTPVGKVWATPELDRETWARKGLETLRERVAKEREAGESKYHDVTYIWSGSHVVMATRTGREESEDVYEVFDLKLERLASYRYGED